MSERLWHQGMPRATGRRTQHTLAAAIRFRTFLLRSPRRVPPGAFIAVWQLFWHNTGNSHNNRIIGYRQQPPTAGRAWYYMFSTAGCLHQPAYLRPTSAPDRNRSPGDVDAPELT
jgi:hypothetical protein